VHPIEFGVPAPGGLSVRPQFHNEPSGLRFDSGAIGAHDVVTAARLVGLPDMVVVRDTAEWQTLPEARGVPEDRMLVCEAQDAGGAASQLADSAVVAIVGSLASGACRWPVAGA